jgi:hypothetical protein
MPHLHLYGDIHQFEPPRIEPLRQRVLRYRGHRNAGEACQGAYCDHQFGHAGRKAFFFEKKQQKTLAKPG